MSVPLVANPFKVPQIKRTEKSEEEKQRDAKRANELVAMQAKLEDELLQKLDELKELCLREAALTGHLPTEIYMTLHPDEPVPKITRRVGTAYSLSDIVLASANTDDAVACIETDIQIQKGIIAATERMSKDRFINKSLRKKHRRDLQSAHHKLRDLERGLHKVRISMSKPDVSSIDGSIHSSSGFSINSLKTWSRNRGNSLRNDSFAKSCPTTPRGSVPDLCDSEDEHTPTWNESRAPSTTSLAQLAQTATSTTTSGTSITTNTSPNDSGIHSGFAESSPPSLPGRRATMPSNRTASVGAGRHVASPDSHLYENIGYTSVAPYKSAYRQSNFPTINSNEPTGPVNDHPPALKTSVSAILPKRGLGSTNFGIKSNSVSQFDGLAGHQNLTSVANSQLGRIVRKMSNATPVNGMHGPNSRLSMANPPTQRASSVGAPPTSGFATASLDRRALWHRQMATIESNGANKETHNTQNQTTTFPVGTDNFQSSSSETDRARARSISQQNGIGLNVPHCTVNPRNHSTSRLPSNEWFRSNRDPQMEALLNFYRSEDVFSKQITPGPVISATPNTRIVPIQQKPAQRKKGATMV
uniref:CUPID domain-containing protein n=1 Tax=Panagrellus redivivus TaxID=6233 RepID=A0A7E4W4S1_PANRE